MTTEWIIFIAFCTFSLALLAGMGYFLRATLSSVASVASIHAKTYAVSYVKGGSLMAIAAGAAFGTAYSALPLPIQASMPWAPYVIFIWCPIAAGLSVLVAFLDRSAQHAGEEKPPFSTTKPPLT